MKVHSEVVQIRSRVRDSGALQGRFPAGPLGT